MTLKGANQALKRGSTNEIVRDTELLERLQRIRAALVEVREELKAEGGDKVIEIDEPSDAESAVVEEQPKKREKVVEKIEPAAEPAVVEEQPKKRVVRRKKKADDENKELFPFYEQSLF